MHASYPYGNIYRASYYTLKPEDLSRIREKIKTMDEIELDKIIAHYKEFESKPLYYHRQNMKKDT